MISLFLYIAALFAFVNSSGEFTILQHPPSIKFEGHDDLKQSILPEVYSASLGLTTHQDSNWQGIYLTDPFHLAKGVAAIVVDGVPKLEVSSGHNFPLHTDMDEMEVYYKLENRIQSHSAERMKRMLRLDLSLDEEMQSIYEMFKYTRDVEKKYNYLNIDNEEDRRFLEELAVLSSISKAVESGDLNKDKIPEVLWLKISSLHVLSDIYGANSTTVKEAKELLTENIYRLNEALKKIYSDELLFTVITSDASHTRRTRRSTKVEGFDERSLAKVYSENYPVMFNIILWFSVVFFFSLLAISVFIAEMDPGRDSIIYRMTSTRMKKEN